MSTQAKEQEEGMEVVAFGSPGDDAPVAETHPEFGESQDDALPDLDRAMILGAPDRKLKRVYVKEWKGHVWIRDMGGVGRDEFEVATTMEGDTNLVNVRAKLLSVCLCNAKGERLFSKEDVVALGEKNARAIAMLYGECSKLNFVTEKDIEDLAKNSGRGATSGT